MYNIFIKHRFLFYIIGFHESCLLYSRKAKYKLEIGVCMGESV